MARYHEPVCRLCRREGMKLFLKGERCFKEKCAVERRSYAPGQHGKRRNKMQPYGLQLREKQKVRRVYGVLERQFRRYFAEANRQKGVTGENLLRLLETRLDNVVYSLGFASSRSQARQLVRHGHVLVDGRRVNLPSFQVRPGMEVALKDDVRSNAFVVEALETAQGRGVPAWLELDSANFRGKVVALPTREDIRLPIQEQLIVELYSR
ncbi:MAG TPA: 30S ribosomal protein S4 [Thermoanaerobaculaceae bacterium]|nr:30S ribosomal protein S4 [Thermoanaerobaculaceae bacterium]HRS17332.1 30S ribosomal protein S4 [Thermoanaerobaculaceae bacterium]